MTALRDSREQVGSRIVPGAGDFWSWWKRSLLAWLPARWRSLLGWSNARVLLAPHAGQVRILSSVGPQLEVVADAPWPIDARTLEQMLGPQLAALPRHGLLPASAVLRRTLWLPAAAERRLLDVVGFEIDRQTPFTPAQVYFDTRLLSRRADGQLEVELVVVPRVRVASLLGPANGADNVLEGVDVAAADGSPLGVNLLPVEQRRQRRDPMRGWNRLLAALALLMLVAAAWQVLDNRRAAARELRAQVDASAARARTVAAQRQQLHDLVDGAAFFDRQRAARPAAVAVLEELSRRLPDGTWLEKLSLEGGQMQLIGLSSSASALVAQLEGSALWTRPSLTGVLQADDGARRDRFTLVAELHAAPDPEAADGAAARSP